MCITLLGKALDVIKQPVDDIAPDEGIRNRYFEPMTLANIKSGVGSGHGPHDQLHVGVSGQIELLGAPESSRVGGENRLLVGRSPVVVVVVSVLVLIIAEAVDAGDSRVGKSGGKRGGRSERGHRLVHVKRVRSTRGCWRDFVAVDGCLGVCDPRRWVYRVDGVLFGQLEVSFGVEVPTFGYY